MKKLNGKIAVVTGAASGIGRELAMGLAGEGCRLALADIDGRGLAETERMATAKGAEVIIQKVDVSKKKEVYAFADQVIRKYGGVDIVINNAGVVYTALIEDLEYKDFERVMNINFWGVVYGTKAFVEHLKKRESANIVNISSVYGLWALPTQVTYNASKFAVRGFTETLMQELEGSGVCATCVYPGGVKTNIVVNAGSQLFKDDSAEREKFIRKFDRVAMTTAEKAARMIISGIRKNKKRIRIGPDAFLFDILQRLMPTWYQKFSPLVLKMMGL